MEGMSSDTRIRLSAMMFLQYMMFAVFWVQLAGYLTNLGVGEGIYKKTILSSMALGCLASPIICMIADRHFASQKVLMVLNFACAVLFLLAALVSTPLALSVLLVLAMLCYMPTWSVTNAIAMTHWPTDKFAQIRLFGSIGWVAAGAFGLIGLKVFGKTIDGTAVPLMCGAVTALAGGLFAMALPNTPPPAKGQKASVVDALGLRSLTLMKDLNFAIFIVLSMLVMIPFTLYFSLGSQFFQSQGYKLITVLMNWGQLVEMGVMLLVPLALARFGVKWTMAVGLGALAIRYFSLWGGVASDQAAAQRMLYYLAILVHGVIFGFFFVGGQVYVDKKAPPEMRAQAQGLIVLICFGVGMLIGTFFNVDLIARNTADDVCNWNPVFMLTAVISAILLGALCLLFKDDVKGAKQEASPEPQAAEAAGQ